jgi:hypothetical protein
MAEEILNLARLKDKGEDISFVQNQNGFVQNQNGFVQNQEDEKIAAIKQILKLYKIESKNTRDWSKANKLIAELLNLI